MNELFWQGLFKQITPILMPLLFGTPVVTFLIHLLSRYDKLKKRRTEEVKVRDISCEAYKRAFWLSEGFSKHLAQIVGPAVIAWRKGDHNTAGAMLEIVFHSLCLAQGAEMTLKPIPNFLKQAKEEIKSAQTQADAEFAAEADDTP